MGRELADAYPRVRELFSTADRVVGFDLSAACVEGDAATLEKTAIQQPAIFLVSAAYLEVFRERCPSRFPMGASAGLSLGEYTALYAAGAVDFEGALSLVRHRGRLMQDAGLKHPGGMACLMGLELSEVEKICQAAAGEGVLTPANLNCPGQIVVSGDRDACQRALVLAAESGNRGVALKVSGAFHSPLMAEAAEELRGYLEETEFRTPGVAVYSNVTAQPHSDPARIRDLLVRQMTSPVLWQRCVENLSAAGLVRSVEFGPGKVLTGLMRRIDRTLVCRNVSSVALLEKVAGQACSQANEVAS